MLLDKKSYELLNYLLKLEQSETITSIAQKLNQSRRKIYYHLDKINESLPENVPKITSISRLGIVLTDEQKKACQLLLNPEDNYFYVMSTSERQKLIILVIASSSERITIDKLIELLDVSRNTILNDLNHLRNTLTNNEHGIKLTVSKSKGYYFEGHPLAFIQYIYAILLRLDTQATSTFFKIAISKLSQLNLDQIITKEPLKLFIQHYFEKSKIILGKTLNQKEQQFFVNSLPYLLLAYRKLSFPKSFKELLASELQQVQKRIEYHFVKELQRLLHINFDLNLDNIEVDIITLLLLSFRKDKDSHSESSDYDEIRQSLSFYLNYFQESFQIRFINQEELLKQLLIHCKSLLYRKRYGIISINPLTDTIKKRYDRLYTMVASTIYLLEGDWHVNLTDDDIAFIVVHIGGAIRRKDFNQKQKHTIIVSDEGIAIQKFLLNRIQRFVPYLKVDAVFTTEQFQSVEDIIKTDFIITTQDNIETHYPVIVVKPLLTDDNLITLLKISQENTLIKTKSFQTKLKECIQCYLANTQISKELTTEIEKLVYRELITELEYHQSH